MTETMTTPDRMSLIIDVFGSEYTNTDLPLRDWRHSDGRPITTAEAVQIALAPVAEFVGAARLIGLRAEIMIARSKDIRRIAMLAAPYQNDDPDVTIGDVLNVMTPAERTEVVDILARLNGDPRDYLNATPEEEALVEGAEEADAYFRSRES